RAAPMTSSGPSPAVCEFRPYAGDLFLRGETPRISLLQASLDLLQLPGIQLDVILDRLGDEPAAGSLGPVSQMVEGLEGFRVQPDREWRGHRHPPVRTGSHVIYMNRKRGSMARGRFAKPGPGRYALGRRPRMGAERR